eukprot:TRINITY_DN1785_c0_g1_i1.p1 TRINITY_DN1785_c0_g1~~TRINITY_DN1785_c0_g1_i1.p1  ORF type:complete len:534 (-),score=105.96 TRINITY_DN1785_c0_g1_i1:66-1667(-)
MSTQILLLNTSSDESLPIIVSKYPKPSKNKIILQHKTEGNEHEIDNIFNETSKILSAIHTFLTESTLMLAEIIKIHFDKPIDSDYQIFMYELSLEFIMCVILPDHENDKILREALLSLFDVLDFAFGKDWRFIDFYIGIDETPKDWDKVFDFLLNICAGSRAYSYESLLFCKRLVPSVIVENSHHFTSLISQFQYHCCQQMLDVATAENFGISDSLPPQGTLSNGAMLVHRGAVIISTLPSLLDFPVYNTIRMLGGFTGIRDVKLQTHRIVVQTSLFGKSTRHVDTDRFSMELGVDDTMFNYADKMNKNDDVEQFVLSWVRQFDSTIIMLWKPLPEFAKSLDPFLVNASRSFLVKILPSRSIQIINESFDNNIPYLAGEFGDSLSEYIQHLPKEIFTKENEEPRPSNICSPLLPIGTMTWVVLNQKTQRIYFPTDSPLFQYKVIKLHPLTKSLRESLCKCIYELGNRSNIIKRFNIKGITDEPDEEFSFWMQIYQDFDTECIFGFVFLSVIPQNINLLVHKLTFGTQIENSWR